MRAHELNRALLARVARALGPHVERFVFVGGILPAIYDIAPKVLVDRGTDDVDCIINTLSRRDYDDLIQDLRDDCGLRDILVGEAPLCRFLVGGEPVDIMPADPRVLGFGNRWFLETAESSIRFQIEDDLTVRIASPLFFVATKLEAFSSEGREYAGDFLASHDMEDLIQVLRGVDGLAEEIRDGSEAVHRYIRAEFARFLQDEDFVDALYGIFESDAPSQASIPGFLQTLHRMAKLLGCAGKPG